MAMTQEQKQRIAEQLAEKRRVMGETGFASYLSKIEAEIPNAKARRVAEQTSFDTDVAPKGVLGFLGKFTGVEKMGVGLGTSLGANLLGTTKGLEDAQQMGTDIQTKLIQTIRDKRARGENTERLELALEDLGYSQEATAKAIGDIATGGVSNRDVLGSAIRTAGTIASFGSYGGTGAVTGSLSKVTMPTATKATTVGRGIWDGVKAGATQGAKMGTIFGGVSGTAAGIEQGENVGGVLASAFKQAVAGGVTGGAVGGVLGGAFGGWQARQNRAKELESILANGDNVDDALAKTTLSGADNVDDVAGSKAATQSSKQRAGYTIENGKVVADKKAQALLKQGIDDKNVAIMQSMSQKDKDAARKMLTAAKRAGDAADEIVRPQEIVGETFMARARDVEKLNQTAGKQIDEIARTTLAGKQIPYGGVYDDLVNTLQRNGVDTDLLANAQNADDIANAFRGSSFDDIPTVQKTLANAFKKVGADDLDGLQLHRLKRYLDNQVTYGKSAEGLTGDAERILKGLRAGIDDVLDTAVPQYNAANTQYRDTIDALDEVRRLIGKEYLGAKNIQNLRAGEVANRLLGNASARPLSALQNLENVAKKYGVTYNDNVIKQIKFADLLDDVYELHPTRGFTGQTSRGIEQAMGFTDRLRTSGVTSALIDTAGEYVQKARGISPESAQRAIEEFLTQ